ncbi:hypothetical protein GSI_07092 [Ganoderma sinense ZZ0214-1]|uniref:Uncharacterized protein n=1 Tax=Ganoderma sinense ZZ0214-1 TaxID=1077348 RepID=A0A2G8SB09_9APHY|nr:hypothetical protein GSI_07092 [Ganoderma sinense ZZ0214-1]
MQNSNSYYAVPQSDGRIWADWQQLGRNRNYSWSNSSSATLGEASSSSSRRSPMNVPQRRPTPISYTLTPPTPSATDSDASSSQISMESIPEYDEYPEIPFVSAAIAGPDGWMSSEGPAGRGRADDGITSTSFWTGIIRMRQSISKSSTDSSASVPVLGHTSERIIAPSRTRKRSGSVSSIASSRTRPAPAKSILSSSASVKTRRHKAPSVKFLDMPTIHYEDDDSNDDDQHEPSSCMSPPPPKKARGLSGFFSFSWLFRSSTASASSSPKAEPPKTKAKANTVPRASGTASGRPDISGPFPLLDSTARRGRSGGSAASLRSMKSSGSLASVRSCGSRLPTPTYWPR